LKAIPHQQSLAIKIGELLLVKKKGNKYRLQSLKGAIMKFLNFLGKRYIWSGLLAGFLWSFSAPFILTIFSSTFQNLPPEVIWIIFFPLTASLPLTQWILNSELVDPSSWLILWFVSVLIGTFLGATFTYSIHRILIWKKQSTNKK
jgi:hypothetical protein